MAYNGMFLQPDDDPREDSKPVGELATYRDYLRNFRLTVEVKCRDLSPEQLATRSVPPSDLSLLGLVRHMARVEHNWFQRCLLSQPTIPRLFDDGTGGFTEVEGTQECVDEAWAAFHEQTAAADAVLDELSDDMLGDHRPLPRSPEETLPIRDVLVHMIEEYARHCGHADLLRECIDGRTGL